jgi:hypothetical protein
MEVFIGSSFGGRLKGGSGWSMVSGGSPKVKEEFVASKPDKLLVRFLLDSFP